MKPVKTTAAELLVLAFIPLFTLRGGAWHHVINFSYLFAALAAATALFLLARRFLASGPGGAVRLRHTDSPLLSQGELLLLLWAAGLTMVMLLTVFHTPAPFAAFAAKGFSYLVMHFILIYFYFLALDPAVLKRLIYLVAGFSVPLLSYQQLYSYFTTGSMLTLTSFYRAHGLMGDPNEFAKNVCVVILILFYVIIFEKAALWVKLLCFSGSGLMLSMLVWSGSRGGFVMLFSAAVLFWLLLFRHFDRRTKIIFYIPVAAAAVVLIIFLSKYDLLTLRFTHLTEQSGNLDRISMSATSLELLLGGGLYNFLFGYGIEAWPSYVPFSIFPHNFVLEYLFEFGFGLGLLILATLGFCFVYPFWRGNAFFRRGLILPDEYYLFKILFIIAIASSIPSLFNHILPTNYTFIFFSGLFLSMFRGFLKRNGLLKGEKDGS